jgi:hypothetical protein
VSLARKALAAAVASLDFEQEFGRLLWTAEDGSKCYRDADEDPECYLPLTLIVVKDGEVVSRTEVRSGGCDQHRLAKGVNRPCPGGHAAGVRPEQVADRPPVRRERAREPVAEPAPEREPVPVTVRRFDYDDYGADPGWVEIWRQS